MTGMAVVEKKLGVCNLCEAICGLELTLEGGRVTGIRGNPDDPLSRGHVCPKGTALADIHADPDRLRRPVRRVGEGPDAHWEETSWDTALDLVADGLAAAHQHPRSERPRHLPRQPQRAQPRLPDPRHRSGEVVPDPQQVQRHLGRPAPPPARRVPDVRPPAAAADPGHRPDVVLPGARRQPDGLQRLADDGARLPRPAARAEGSAAAGWWWSTRAAPRPPRSPPSTTSSGPAPTRTCCWRCSTCSTPRDSPALRGTSTGWTGSRRRSPRSPPRWPSRSPASRRRRSAGSPGSSRRPTARSAYGRVGVSTHAFGTVCQWAVQLLNLLTGNLDREGGACFTSPAIDAVGSGLHQQGPPRRVAQPGPRAAGVRRRAAGVGAARGDRDTGRRPGAGAAHPRRQPGLVDARRWRARPGDRRAGLHGRRRHLRQRDHPARRRDPAADDHARARPLRPGLPRAGGPQHGPLHPGGAGEGGRRDARLGDLPRDRAAHPGAAAAEGTPEEAAGPAGAPLDQPDPVDRAAAATRVLRA